jgi:hypothetical protein
MPASIAPPTGRLFEDPTGVRLVYDAGASVAGATDPRLGEEE